MSDSGLYQIAGQIRELGRSIENAATVIAAGLIAAAIIKHPDLPAADVAFEVNQILKGVRK
jgi:hypothetical protein